MTTLNLNNDLAILEVNGSDATNFLQGQLTNDIRELNSPNTIQLSAHLNNKGRILATFFITSPAENNYYLITSKDILEKILPRLKMFILRSKVAITVSDKNITLSQQPIINCYTTPINDTGYYFGIGELPSEAITNSQQWHKFLVDNNLPMIYLNSYEKIIPQQINYDLTGGINFKKGCYTGQEIVARTHYLGKVKRRLAKFTSDYQPQIGQTVVSTTLDNQEAGFIIDYYYNEAISTYSGLVSLQNNCLENSFLDLANLQPLICQSTINE